MGIGILLFSACTKQAESGTAGLSTITIFAESSQSRSCISSTLEVRWMPSDVLSVLDQAGNHKFVTEDHGSSANFSGTALKNAEKSFALFPYSEENSCDVDNGIISTVFPTDQYGVPGSFSDQANLAAGIIENHSFTARNVGGIISVTLTRSDITSVKISSCNAGDALSGGIRISFDGQGVPAAEAVDKVDNVKLLPTDGLSSLQAGTYFIAVLPGELAGGYKMEITCQNGYVKTVVNATPLSIGRSKCVEFGVIDSDMPEDRVVILFGDSITHNNVYQWMNSLVSGKNTSDVRYRAVHAGRSGETPSQITARLGGVPLYVKGKVVIPARASEKVLIQNLYTDISESGEKMESPTRELFVDLGSEATDSKYTGCSNPFMIEGVLCKITGTAGKLYLNRVYNSETATVISGPFTIASPLGQWKYSNAWAHSCYMGTNGEGDPKIPYNHEPGELHSYEDLGRFYELAQTSLPANAHFLALGFHNSRWTENSIKHLAGKFGDIFVDLRTTGYQNAETIASEIGATLDDTDYSYIADKQWPWSWQDPTNTIHPSETGHKAYAQIAFDKMKALEWF